MNRIDFLKKLGAASLVGVLFPKMMVGEDKPEKHSDKFFHEKIGTEKITKLVKSYEDACRYNGEKPIHLYNVKSTDTIDEIAYKRLKYTFKTLNEDQFKMDGKEKRWYVWFWLDNSSPSGLRFGHTHYSNGLVTAASAAHLCFKTREDAEDAAKKFIHIYAGFVWPKNTPATFSERKIDMKILLCKSRR